MAVDEDLRKRREEICLGHMRAENAHRFDEAIGFFARPRYGLVATGEVFDGAGPLGGLMQENVTAFPDFHYDFTHLHHAEDVIVVEGSFRGTHEGKVARTAGYGRRVDFPMLIVFPFEGDRMMGERIYFDLSTALASSGWRATRTPSREDHHRAQPSDHARPRPPAPRPSGAGADRRS